MLNDLLCAHGCKGCDSGNPEEQQCLSATFEHKEAVDSFIAGFICAGGDADEAKAQAKQYVSCVNAGRT